MYRILISLIGIFAFALIIFFRRFFSKLPQLIYWLFIDFKSRDPYAFNDYGCWFFVGRQGAGKTMSMVETLEQYRKKYPNLKIYTNFGYIHETAPLLKLSDLLDRSLYNDDQGTIFAIDEIQNEFSCSTSKDFPESVLSVVTQQRKEHILILCTSQVFSRVSKPLREQCFRAIECGTILGRYTMCRHYDGVDYADTYDMTEEQKRVHRPRIYYHSFVQTDELRNCYDSYKIIERLDRNGFVSKIST